MKTTALVTVELLSFCPLSSLTKSYYYSNNTAFTWSAVQSSVKVSRLEAPYTAYGYLRKEKRQTFKKNWGVYPSLLEMESPGIGERWIIVSMLQNFVKIQNLIESLDLVLNSAVHSLS